MPRQPLPRNLHSGPWSIGPFLAAAERPEHTALIGSCMTVWPAVAHQMGLILGVLLGADNEAAVAVFATLQNARARRDALNAVAQIKLNERQQELFNAIISVVTSTEKERDSLAHGCFGVSEAIPDGILWIESKHFGPWNVETILKKTQITAADHQKLAKNIYVYRKSDLDEIYNQLCDAFLVTSQFLDYIRHMPAPMSPEDDARYRQLCNLSRVATALRQTREGKKK